MIALRNLKRVINIRLYNTCSENMSSLAQEPLYELNSPIQIDTFGNKMTYFGELKKLSHYTNAVYIKAYLTTKLLIETYNIHFFNTTVFCSSNNK